MIADWADEEAAKLQIGVVTGDMMTVSIFVVDEIAAALRKAKAAGLREAAEIVVMNSNANYSLQIHSFANGVTQAIGDIADKLEKGEA